MVAIDEGHEDELKSLTTNPHAELPMDTDTAWKRELILTLRLRPPAQNTDWGHSVPSLLSSLLLCKSLIATAATKKL